MNSQQSCDPAPPASETSAEELIRKERIKAEARAYALSSTTSSRRRKRSTDAWHLQRTRPVHLQAPGVSGPFPYPPVVPGRTLKAPVPQSASLAPGRIHQRPPFHIGVPPVPIPHPTHQTARPPLAHPPHPSQPSHRPPYPPPPLTAESLPQAGPLPSSNPSALTDNEPPDDYQLFVRSLAWDEDLASLMDSSSIFAVDDEEDEFQLDEDEEEDDDEEEGDDEDEQRNDPATPKRQASDPVPQRDPRQPSSAPGEDLEPEDLEKDFHIDLDLEKELNWLEEEDWEAAVATLLTEHQTKTGTESDASCRPTNDSNYKTEAPLEDGKKSDDEELEFRQTLATSRLRPTKEQRMQLEGLLQKHHQLLLQQAVLVTRAANVQRKARDQRAAAPALPPSCTESAEDLAEILDGAVGMLQDLDQNRKDAIRHYIQFADATWEQTEDHVTRRALWSQIQASRNHAGVQSPGERRLTRAQFSKTLDDRFIGEGLTVFAIPGINKLNETFSYIDKSVAGLQVGNILEFPSHALACRQLLVQAGSACSSDLIPGSRDLSEHFIDINDYFGDDFKPPCTEKQESMLRRSRNMFTSGEDNLVMRGVNLYGEKQWLLVADRFLPDRSANIVSQRYGRICTLLYKANGLKIDDDGNLETPPKCENIDDVDAAKLAEIQTVNPPAILNVHRWSLEEDLSLLKAVLVLGNMWAEIAARVLPHRDRGHIRKRYQVLSRRVKAAVQRTSKTVASLRSPQKRNSPQACQGNSGSPVKSPVLCKQTIRLGSTEASAVPEGSNRLAMGAVSQAAAILASARNAPVKQSNHPRAASSSTSVSAQAPSHRPTSGRASFAKTSVGNAPLHSAPRKYTTPSKSKPPVPAATSLHEEDSRAAFELLAAGGSPGWSQMAHITEMIQLENTDEQRTKVAASSSDREAEFRESPDNRRKRPTTAEYSPMNVHDDPSGLSILHSVLDATPEKATLDLGEMDASRDHGSDGVGFFAGVMERTRSNTAFSHVCVPEQPKSPLKLQITGPTPSHGHQSLHPASATAFTNSSTAAADASVSFPPFFSPSDSRTVPSHGPRPVYMPLPTYGTHPPYRPYGGPTSPQSPPLTLGTTLWGSLGYPAPAGHPLASNHEGECPRSGGGGRRRSRSSRESSSSSSSASLSTPGVAASAAATPQPSVSLRSPTASATLTPQSLFGGDDGATLLETDLEAISTLNSLSHSPAEPASLLLLGEGGNGPQRRPWDGRADSSSSADASAPAEEPQQRTAATSLFAKVVRAGGDARPAPAGAAASSTVKKRRLCF